MNNENYTKPMTMFFILILTVWLRKKYEVRKEIPKFREVVL